LLAEEQQRKTRVLIVGAGLTGCLTSYLLQRQCGESIDLRVLERSPYPSGRFGAGVRYDKGIGTKWCDMGSQVLSALNCNGGHPNACTSGHGMFSKDLHEAWELVNILAQAEIISRVPNDGEDETNPLEPTEERMIFDNLWAHFWPTSNSVNQMGLAGVMADILSRAAPVTVEFNRQVQHIVQSSEEFLVYSTALGGDLDDPKSKVEENCNIMNTADIIIVTLPSIQASNLIGHFLPPFVRKDLENIQYESRASCSLVARMSSKLAVNTCKLFGPDKTEINLELMDSSTNKNIHLLIWQDRKSKSYEAIQSSVEETIKDETIELSFTIHSTPTSFQTFNSSQDFETYAHNFLLDTLVGVKPSDGESCNKEQFEVVKSRAVLWTYSQPTGPMETLYTEVADLEKAYPYGPAYVDDSGLILAGDYFTLSSYVGCFSSAAAAARGVRDILGKKNKERLDLLIN